MAEIILEPTALSKVIPLSLKTNEVDSSLVGQLITNSQFNTADTDAWFSFTLDGLAATTGTFDLALINLNDKSVFNHTAKVFNTNPFYYKLDSGTDELTNEIRHAGKWVGQLVVTLPNGDSATRKFIFAIEGHILDGTVVQTILLEDYNALIADIEASKDELTQYNIDYASLIGTVTSQEAARVQAELTRTETFNALVDSEIIAQNVATELQNVEATYAPRLLSAEQQLAQTSAQVDLLNRGLGETFATLVALQTAYPTGDTKDHIVAFDGHRYFWNETTVAWADGGAYQAVEVGIGAVSLDNMSSVFVNTNKLDIADVMIGQYYGSSTTTVGGSLLLRTSASWDGNATPIPVNEGDIVRFNKAYLTGYYVGFDDANICRQIAPNVSTIGYKEITVAANVTKFYTSIYAGNVGAAMITINEPMPAAYLQHYPAQKSLEWLQVNENNLDANLVTKINQSGALSVWYGKNAVWFGDSIVIDVNNTGGGFVTRIKTILGLATNDNKGISGRPMADGTANGVGTVTTGLAVDYSPYDLSVIAAGTNDFKLNVALGTLGVIGDTTFNRNTFYGAYRTLLEYILTQKPTERIVLFTPLQRDNGGYDVNTTNGAGHKLIDYVNAIKAIGQMYSIPVCDMYSNSGITKLNLATYTSDGLHPIASGYVRMASYGAKFIDGVGL